MECAGFLPEILKPVFTGRVAAILNGGSIIIVEVRRGSQLRRLYFDEAPYRWLIERIGPLVTGEQVTVLADKWGAETIRRDEIDA